jgi:hypothetical protein
MSEGNPFRDERPSGQTFQHTPVGARVPERLAKGVYSTGQVILDSPREFVIDFLQGLTRPYQVALRVVMAPPTFEELSKALRENIDNYTRSFGPPPSLPIPVPEKRPGLAEIYDNFKIPEEQLSGAYANAVLIGHSPAEFFLDFVTGFYPTAAVSGRVFMAAGMAPRFLTSVESSLASWKQRNART